MEKGEVMTALDNNAVKEQAAIVPEQIAAKPEPMPNVYGIRLNFANGLVKKFEFDAVANPVGLAGEINKFLQYQKELLDIKDDEGKRAFRAGDLLPNRKATIDIVMNGHLLKASLMNVPLAPRAIFKNEGKLFTAIVNVLLKQAKQELENPKHSLIRIGA